MKPARSPAMFALAMSLAIPAGAADPVLKEGLWEMTTKSKMPGIQMPKLPEGVELPPGIKLDMDGPTITHTMCVTKEQMVPQDEKAAEDCKMEHMNKSGNTVEWKMTCKTEDGEMVGVGKATYTGDTMSSEIKMTGKSDGQVINMTQSTTGKYVGACDKKG